MGTLFQTSEWEEFKLATGYQASYRIDDILVLQKNLPLGRSMLYSPLIAESQMSLVETQNFITKMNNLASKNKAIFYRAELDIPIDRANLDRLATSGYVKSFEEMQPEHTLLLNINRKESEILAQMKQKGRYNIKIARKSGVTVREDRTIDNFYNLYSTMAKRQNITFRSKDYFKKLFDILQTKRYVKVLTAYTPERKVAEEQKNRENEEERLQATTLIHASHPIASAIISFYGERATYLFGGSSDQHRNTMAPYLVQWTAILEAKSYGCKTYDFFGISPNDNPKHAWQGVTRFKKQFGGEEVQIAGSYDLIFRPLDYQLFKMAEKIRRS